MEKQRTFIEIVEDLVDEFDFIECHEIDRQRYEDSSPIGSLREYDKRIRTFRREAEKVLKAVLDQALEYEKLAENKYQGVFYERLNDFLAVGCWVKDGETKDKDGKVLWTDKGGIYLHLYFVTVEKSNRE